ncbi:MAG: response regulator [Nevskia sp.]|nr:response regulator [Nevskia sp.]
MKQTESGSGEEPVVFIVDDEEAVRDSIGLLLRSVGVRSRGFADARAFLDGYQPEQRGCLVLDIRMPRMSGMELQQELNRRGWAVPIIFITGHGDVPMAVEAMRAGAVDFLQKPFKDDELIRRVQKALEQDARLREQLSSLEQIRTRFDSLTPREREIAARLAAGDANKAVAIDLGLSERTVELHRAHIMQKMGARGLAQLVQMLFQLKV